MGEMTHPGLPVAGEVWMHRNGKRYLVDALARNHRRAETVEGLAAIDVVYVPLYRVPTTDPVKCTRTLSDFLDAFSRESGS